ncbi:MAG: Fic family protein [Candidatus Woesearchaeota archaeon]
MAYIETIKRGNKKFYYLTQTIRIGKNFKKVRRLLGKGKIPEERLKRLAKQAGPGLQEKISETKTIRKILQLDPATEKGLAEIKKDYQKIIKKLSPIEYQIIEKQHLIRFTFNTNAIEGSTITLKETAHILEDGIAPEGKELREIHEIENTKRTYEFMKEYNGKISTKFIKQIHYNLTFNILKEQAGKFRSIQVYMGGSKHPPTKPSEIVDEMKNLMGWITNHSQLHPVILAAYVHHFFIAIHPFVDGNGRTGRLLLNFMLMKAGFPPICIRLGERIKYTDYLEEARDGDIISFVNFLVQKSKEAHKELVDNTKDK